MTWLTRIICTAMIAIAPVASACPFCAENASGTDAASPAGVPAGFNASIYVILITFGMVLAGVILSMVQAARRHSR